MKKITLFIFLLVGIKSFAQNDRSKWSIGIQGMPEYSMMKIAMVQPMDPVENFAYQDYKKNYLPSIKYNAGLYCKYEIYKNLYLKSGLYFSERGYKGKKIDYPGNDGSKRRYESRINDSIYAESWENALGFWSIPLIASYSIHLGKTEINFGIGIEYNSGYYYKGISTYYDGKGVAHTFSDFTKMSYTYGYGIGELAEINIFRQLSPSLKIGLCPSLRYERGGFGNFFIYNPRDYYAIGCGISLEYSFKK